MSEVPKGGEPTSTVNRRHREGPSREVGCHPDQIRPERIQHHLVRCRAHNPGIDPVICPSSAIRQDRPERGEQYLLKFTNLRKYQFRGCYGDLILNPPSEPPIFPAHGGE